MFYKFELIRQLGGWIHFYKNRNIIYDYGFDPLTNILIDLFLLVTWNFTFFSFNEGKNVLREYFLFIPPSYIFFIAPSFLAGDPMQNLHPCIQPKDLCNTCVPNTVRLIADWASTNPPSWPSISYSLQKKYCQNKNKR